MPWVESLERRVLMAATFGPTGSVQLRGDWDGDGVREAGAVKEGYLYQDLNRDGFADITTERTWLGIKGGIPLVMDVNANHRDEVGVLKNGGFSIDLNNDNTIGTTGDLIVTEAPAGTKITAARALDVNGDGHKDIVFRVAGEKFWRADFWRLTDDLPAFASALSASGAKLYGAYWCSHCKRQEANFHDGAANLPYVECSKPDHTQNQTAIDAGIETYPTWIFTGGARLTGNQTPEALSTAAGVAIPSRPAFGGNARVKLAELP